jgi:hypothetical protein
MALLDLVGELTGTIPGLSPILAEKYIQRAWRSIRDKRLWAFLATDAAVVCPAVVQTGSANITQYSVTVTLDAIASGLLLAQATPGATPGLTNMQIRFGATTPAMGQVYNILAANITVPAAIVLTLDRVVQEATNAASTLQVYRCYVIPPADDFLKWESVVDMANSIRPKLDYSSAFFDARDPQRSSQGLAYFMGRYAGAFVPDPTTGTVVPNPNVNVGTIVYELWPHPTQGQVFYVRFRRRGTDFTSITDTQPAEITDDLILSRALYADAYPFVGANKGNFPSFKSVAIETLITAKKAEYVTLLQDAKRNDDEAAMQSVIYRGHGLRTRGLGGFKGDDQFPIDSNYLQSHLVRF